jgi:hypothetical protein
MAISKLKLGKAKYTHTFNPALMGKLAGKLSVAKSMIDMGCQRDAADWIDDQVYDAVKDLVQESLDRLPLPLEAEVVEDLINLVFPVAGESLAREVVSTAIGSVYTSQTDETYLRFVCAYDGTLETDEE